MRDTYDTSKSAYELQRDMNVAKQQREDKKNADAIKRMSDRVMNQKTDPTGMYGANKILNSGSSLEKEITKIIRK